MKKLKIALASFLIVNSFAMAENITDFQAKAVKELYSKGILQSIVKEEDFSKKDNFSRGEIAAIIYNTISLKNAETVKSATPEEIVILKALVSDFSNELGKLGAADYDLLQKIDNQNKTINQRIDSEVALLNKKIDRINVSGDFSIVKEFNTKQTDSEPDKDTELMRDLKGEGDISLNLNISENVTGKIGYNLDKEEGEYELNINKNGLTILAFNDDTLTDEDWYKWNGKKYNETTKASIENPEDDLDTDGNKKRSKALREDIASKKLPEFDNNLGIISKAGINNKDTIVVKKDMNGKELLALVTSTDDEDIYGVQFKKKMPYFMIGEGSDSNMIISYVGEDDKKPTEYDKSFLILGADFKFPINGKATETLKYNYVKMREDKTELSVGSDNSYNMPIIADEANYVHSKTEVDSKKLGKVEVSLGAVNTGYNFDASGLADSEKELFAETDDLIKLDSNIFGGVAVIKNTKGKFENTISSISYKTNDGKIVDEITNTTDTMEDDTTDDTTTRIDTLYSVNSKVKLGIGVGSSTKTLYDYNDTKSIWTYTDYSRTFVEGQIHLKDVVSKNSTNVIKVKYGNGKDETNDTEKKETVAYVDYKKTIKNANVVLASQFEDSVEENTLKTAFYYEKDGKLSEKYKGNILLGGRYDKGLDKADTATYGEEYRVFSKFGVDVKENITLEGGARYGKELGAEADSNFAVGLTYKITENSKISGIYGPLTVLNDYSSDIFEYNTDGIYGDDEDQNTGSIKISVKF